MSWPLVKLKECCTITMGQAPKGDTYNTEGQGYALIAGAGDFGFEKPKPKKFTSKPTRLSDEGDIILCIRATIGDINWSDMTYCLGRGVAGLKPQPTLDALYLWYFIKVNKRQLESEGTGSTFKQVSRSHVENWKIPLPPLPEQKRIAAILDKADQLRQKRQQAITLADDFLRSVFLDMFGDPVTNPKGWERVSIDCIALKVTDGEHQTPKREDRGYKLLSARNIQQGYINTTTEKVDYVGEKEFQRISKRLTIEQGDVLISCSGTIGRVSVNTLNEQFCLVRSVAVIKLDRTKVLPNYLMVFLQTVYLQLVMQKEANSSSQKNLFQNQIKKLKILTPPIEQQEIFVAKYQKYSTIKSKIQDISHVDNTLFNALSQKAFAGEL
ncbi:restriction endonuclease subunit S [Candidatus Sororendozoicomonas aggregata]|uniref:restriction endonuclease subunit S n=1 Tax=Candidatus Sororendozoicomonas aggregata TaxID=3073239 RepID=UPI002ED117B9